MTTKEGMIQTILDAFRERGDESYADEGVTQRQHALQTAALAIQQQAPESLILAALLHDIGHILQADQLPASCDENLDDDHESVGHRFLSAHFGPAVVDPVHLHVAAKRFLCTTDPEYQKKLSPTSLKSYFDQGGPMTESEISEFESQPFFVEALQLRRWDDQAKDPLAESLDIEYFVPLLEGELIN